MKILCARGWVQDFVAWPQGWEDLARALKKQFALEVERGGVWNLFSQAKSFFVKLSWGKQ